MKMRVKIFAVVLLTLISHLLGECTANEAKTPEISAPSAILIDQNSGKILYESNSNEVKYSASLMKIMNLIICFQEIEEGRLNLNESVRITDEIESAKGSGVWLKSGESVTVEDLVKSIALVSANDACSALAVRISGEEGKFISKMNEFASKLNLKNTIFKNCMGNDEDGNVTTAHDIAYMAKKLLEYENSSSYLTSWIDHIRNEQTQLVNTNKLLKTYQGATGVKTGTSKEAGSCICASAERNGIKLIAVVLGCQNPTERNREISNLLDFGFTEFSLASPRLPENFPKSLKVKNGMKQHVEITALMNEVFLVSNKNSAKIHSEIILDDSLEAPLSNGKKVGEIIYRQGDELMCVCDIITQSAILEIKFMSVLRALTMNFFNL